MAPRFDDAIAWFCRFLTLCVLSVSLVTLSCCTIAHDGVVGIESVDVSVDVIGHNSFALTTTRLVFRNHLNRILEHSLSLSLLDGQTIVGFGMSVDENLDNLRRGVAVKKSKGQRVFEEIVGGRVDPGLLERTEGNNYRVRVYPIPPNGRKTVEIVVLERTLGQTGVNLSVPLSFGRVQDTLKFRAVVHDYFPEDDDDSDSAFDNNSINNKLPRFDVWRGIDGIEFPSTWTKDGSSLVAEVVGKGGDDGWIEMSDFLFGPAALEMKTVADESSHGVSSSYVETRDGVTFFSVDVPLPVISPIVEADASLRPIPDSVGIVWDSSASGSIRNHEKEFSLLDAYFRNLSLEAEKEIHVYLARLHIEMEPPQHYVVSAEGALPSLLLQKDLERTNYDGGTSLGSFLPFEVDRPIDAYLIFSDGLSNFGHTEFPNFLKDSKTPAFVIHSAVAGDTDRLRIIAEEKSQGGVFVDLTRQSEDSALRSLLRFTLGVLSVKRREVTESGVIEKEFGSTDGIYTTLGKSLEGYRSVQVLGTMFPGENYSGTLILNIGTS